MRQWYYMLNTYLVRFIFKSVTLTLHFFSKLTLVIEYKWLCEKYKWAIVY